MSSRPTFKTDDEHPPPLHLCVLMTSFNRRDKTLACMEALAANLPLSGIVVHGILVDDASRDGTAEAVAEAWPWMEVLAGDGGLYWCRGMHQAFAAAMAQGHDWYLWLNDDTLLMPDAVKRLLDCERLQRKEPGSPAIIVGSTVDAITGTLTYGGARSGRRWNKRLAVERITPAAQPQRCDAMNGNIVLVNAAAAGRLGNLDPGFEHGMGDMDYALRAGRAGVPVWLAPHVHGTCSHNPQAGTWRDLSLPMAERWKRINDRKGLPWRSWLRFTRRHAGWLWPLYFGWPYARLVLESARQRLLQPRTLRA